MQAPPKPHQRCAYLESQEGLKHAVPLCNLIVGLEESARISRRVETGFGHVLEEIREYFQNLKKG